MTISEFIFRMLILDEYDIIIDGVHYDSFLNVPDVVYPRQVYTWGLSGIDRMTLTIETREKSVEQVLCDRLDLFPDYSNEQLILMLRNGVTISDLIDQLEDE